MVAGSRDAIGCFGSLHVVVVQRREEGPCPYSQRYGFSFFDSFSACDSHSMALFSSWVRIPVQVVYTVSTATTTLHLSGRVGRDGVVNDMRTEKHCQDYKLRWTCSGILLSTSPLHITHLRPRQWLNMMHEPRSKHVWKQKKTRFQSI